MPERIEEVTQDKFIDSPGDFICQKISEQLVLVPQFKAIFGDAIDAYKRMDYSVRALPALRIYNNTYQKPDESWFINGDIIADIIFPANLRRLETQNLQDLLTGALMQQFRRPTFFLTLTGLIPGLNELGRKFNVDKSLGFEWDNNEVPLTQITLNFKLDLREWDLYLESTDRTKDIPFEKTLANLDTVVNTVQGLRDDNTTVEVTTEQQTDI